jgi:DNA-binding CsgD family transcriptional regulator
MTARDFFCKAGQELMTPDLPKLVGAIYETTAEPGSWHEFLKSLAEALDADAVFLQRHQFSDHRSEILAAYGVSPSLQEAYNSTLSALNVWREAGEQSFIKGQVLSADRLIPTGKLRDTEFYRAFLEDLGCAASIEGIIARNNGQAHTIAAMRRNTKPAWEPGDQEILRDLLPHLARMCRLHQRSVLCRTMEMLMDGSEAGVMLLSAGARVLHANLTAKRVLAAEDGLALRSGVLCWARRTTNESVMSYVNEAQSAGMPIPVRIDRISMQRPFHLVVIPISLKGVILEEVHAAVLVSDAEQAKSMNPALLSGFYDLTPKEAVIANLIHQGKTLERVARELNISGKTARTHLRRIFSKTRTSRQAELVALLGRIPHVAALFSNGSDARKKFDLLHLEDYKTSSRC